MDSQLDSYHAVCSKKQTNKQTNKPEQSKQPERNIRSLQSCTLILLIHLYCHQLVTVIWAELDIRDDRSPGAVVNDRVVLFGHSVEHSQVTKHVHHEIQEALSSSSLHYSTEQSKGVGGVQESGACM